MTKNLEEKIAEIKEKKLNSKDKYEMFERFLIEVFKNDEIPKEEKKECIQEVLKYLELPQEEKEKLMKRCVSEYNQSNLGKKEYAENVFNDISEEDDTYNEYYEIVPAMDYTSDYGLSYLAMTRNKEGKTEKYFVSSNKDICLLADTEKRGINLKHKNSKTKFSLSAFKKYYNGVDNVNAGRLFCIILEYLKTYIFFPLEEIYDVFALWIMHTYVYCIFRYVPYIWITADAGSGKSTVMDAVKQLAFNGIANGGITSANIYRLIENDGVVFILDEFENMKGSDKSLILQILNLGFKQGATILRCSEKNYEPMFYSAFAPKIFGGITEIDEVLQSRCIKVNMQRVVNRNDIKDFSETLELKKENAKIINLLYIFGLKYINKIYDNYLKDITSMFPKEYTPREFDLWKPLISIAFIVDNEAGTETVNSILKYSEIQHKEMIKIRNKDIKSRLIFYLEEYLEEEDITNEHPNWFKLQDIYNKLSFSGDFEEIKSYEALGKCLNTIGVEKRRLYYKKSYDSFSAEKKTAYYITKEVIRDLKKKYKLDN